MLLSRACTNHEFVRLIWPLIPQRNWESFTCICFLQSTGEEHGLNYSVASIQTTKEITLCWKLWAPLAGWYQLPGVCTCCLPGWSWMDSSVCPSITSFPSQSNILVSYKVKTFVFIIFFLGYWEMCQRLENSITSCQSIYSSKFVYSISFSARIRKNKRQHQLRSRWFLCRTAAVVLAATVLPPRQGHFLPQKAKQANACRQQMGFGKELDAVVGSALGQGCGGSAQELEV